KERIVKLKSHIRSNKYISEITVLLSIPILLILIVLAVLFLPRLFANPGYDFVYCTGYSCSSEFSTNENGEITQTDSDLYRPYRESSSLHLYDVSEDSS